MSAVHSFAEEAVWDRADRLRPMTISVAYRLELRVGEREIRSEFLSSYGLFYDPDDLMLLQTLTEHDPSVDWGSLVFWKVHRRGEIRILDPLTESEVGHVTVRRGRLSETADMTNVVAFPRKRSS